MFYEGLRPAWVEIDMKALANNIDIIKSQVTGGVRICGIVKGNAYGHGVLKVVELMREKGIEDFGVATVQEAIEIRDSGVKDNILLLSLTPDIYAPKIVEYDIMPVFCTLSFAKAVSAEAVKQGKNIRALGAIDTGMGRIGYQAEDPEAISELLEANRLPNFRVAGIMSHFATSDAEDRTYADRQEQRFRSLRQKLLDAGLEMDYCTLANSPATADRPSSHFDVVRPGGTFYGRYMSDCTFVPGIIQEVMSVKANIVHIKNVPEGFSVGYDRKFISKRPSVIATLNLGGGDGLNRGWWESGRVIVKGHYAPFAGAICMDQCMIDVTDVPDVRLGDEVILVGTDGDLRIRVEEIAESMNSVANDVTIAFAHRLPVFYIK